MFTDACKLTGNGLAAGCQLFYRKIRGGGGGGGVVVFFLCSVWERVVLLLITL